MTRPSNQRGQAVIIMVLFLGVLLGIGAAVLDVGAWYRADRQVQATADAAALAGAQALPEDPADSAALALEYSDKNGGGVASGDIEVTQSVLPNDTIKVRAEKPMPGFFAKLFGRDNVTVGATATARSGIPNSAKHAAPIGVDELHPDLQCKPQPCFGSPTTLRLDKVGPGAFRILNIDGSKGGQSSATLGVWIRDGLDAYMPLKWYWSDPGSSFNSGHVRDALDDRIGEELLFPVYRNTKGGGSNFEYEVVGWVGFHLTGFKIGGKGELHGWFTRVIWEGIQSENAGQDDFGVRAVSLVE
jgi:Putative Flp pilus-assembly TadE/G-like